MDANTSQNLKIISISALDEMNECIGENFLMVVCSQSNVVVIPEKLESAV